MNTFIPNVNQISQLYSHQTGTAIYMFISGLILHFFYHSYWMNWRWLKLCMRLPSLVLSFIYQKQRLLKRTNFLPQVFLPFSFMMANWFSIRVDHSEPVDTKENKSEIASIQYLQKLLSLSTLILWLSSSTLAMLDTGTVRKSLDVLGIVDSAILNSMMDTAMKKMYNNGKFFSIFSRCFVTCRMR